jgi:uncharacterized membrane protein
MVNAINNVRAVEYLTHEVIEKKEPTKAPSPNDVLMEPRRMRLNSLDTWRGLVIFLMMLDHVRDFFNRGALISTPTDAGHTTVPLYVTRWITHLCAPTFLFLAGVGIRLQYEKAGPSLGLSQFLATRGAWLVLLDLTVVSAALSFGRPFFFVQVLYATGLSMIVMAALVWIRPRVVLVIGGAILLLAPLTILPLLHATGVLGLFRTFTVLPGPLPAGMGIVLYPFVPWLGVMCLGFGYGHVFLFPKSARDRTIAWTGAGSLLIFCVLRGLNGYGDLTPWKAWPDATRNIESFLDVTKYPPSPDYVLVTLGISLLVFLVIERLPGTVSQPLTTFGRTPLFTYIAHFFVLHCFQIGVGLSLGYPLRIFLNYIATAVSVMFTSGNPPEVVRLGWGFPLLGTYLVWLTIVALVYPLSRWFEGVKHSRQDWWLRYL